MAGVVMHLHEIDRRNLPEVGGKAANLGELLRAGFPVPEGFCITTEAYRRFIETSEDMKRFFDSLDRLRPGQLEDVRIMGRQIRDHLQSLPIPADLEAEIIGAWEQSGQEHAYAVRSSATAEDLPTASFAGQQDTILNVQGAARLLEAVKRCWASLFTDRAILYRIKNGFAHRTVFLSVMVQKMVMSEVSGILFTADPVSGHRGTISIDAGFGLGEALVSGIVSADLYQVRNGEIVKKQISEKNKVILPARNGGMEVVELSPELGRKQALSDEQILKLAELGKKIECHCGVAQDIEWGLSGDRFFVLQSRPITTLFPLPPHLDGRLRVFCSFGHTQMMTDAMKPLALSVWRTLMPLGRRSGDSRGRMLVEAGGRLYFDPTELMYWKVFRKGLPRSLKSNDELMSDALSRFLAREDFLKEAALYRASKCKMIPLIGIFYFSMLKGYPRLIKTMFSKNLQDVARRAEAAVEKAVARCQNEIFSVNGPERIKRIRARIANWISFYGRELAPGLLAAFVAQRMLLHLGKKWLGEDQAEKIAALNKSLPGNVTSEMGLMIGDLADLLRPYPQLAAYLDRAEDRTFYEGLDLFPGGSEFKKELHRFMERYGMRCPGEIDLTRKRWRESPTMLVPSILSHMRSNEPGEHRKKFNRGKKEAEEAAQEILACLRKKRGGWLKRKWISCLIAVYRNLMGLRELPKYMIIRCFDHYRQAILEEGRFLRERGTIEHEEDLFYLTLDEIIALLENRLEDVARLIAMRKQEFARYVKMTPPRVMTSEGEVITGRRSGVQVPPGALSGIPVSPGLAEGYVKVVRNLEEGNLEKGDILVAPYTDPGWTPLFHSARALIMEAGGLMTHGSVVAREYGIPAVVGIDRATERLKDGQFVRVDGTQGVVEVLEQPAKI